LNALVVTTNLQCGADKSEQRVFVTTPDGESVLYDDFYHCTDDGKTYVHGASDVIAVLDAIANVRPEH